MITANSITTTGISTTQNYPITTVTTNQILGGYSSSNVTPTWKSYTPPEHEGLKTLKSAVIHLLCHPRIDTRALRILHKAFKAVRDEIRLQEVEDALDGKAKPVTGGWINMQPVTTQIPYTPPYIQPQFNTGTAIAPTQQLITYPGVQSGNWDTVTQTIAIGGTIAGTK